MRYVVAKYDSFEGSLSLTTVTAESKIDAVLCKMQVTRADVCESLGKEDFELEELISLSYNWNTPIEILELEADAGS